MKMKVKKYQPSFAHCYSGMQGAQSAISIFNLK